MSRIFEMTVHNICWGRGGCGAPLFKMYIKTATYSATTVISLCEKSFALMLHLILRATQEGSLLIVLAPRLESEIQSR